MVGSAPDAAQKRESFLGTRRRGRALILQCWALCLACVLQTTSSQASSRATRRDQPDGQARGREASSWRSYRKPAWRRGYVKLDNPGNGRSWSGYVIGPGETVLPKAEREIRAVLASWRSGRSCPIHPRLIRLVAQVSDVFGGRTIRVVSGYREKSHAKDSHHKHGEAFDFGIDGVPNWAVRDYLRSLSRTGVGYYPNSNFVHLDVRERQAYWIDVSRPGQPPRYVAEHREPLRVTWQN